MKTSIHYLHIPLKRRPGFNQNEGKTNPALVTTQESNSAPFFLPFKAHSGDQIPSETKFWAPLHEDNDSDIIVAV